MKKEKTINLPFIETVKRSFMYTLCNWELFLKVASLGLIVIVVEMFTGFPTVCSLSGGNCQSDGMQILSNMLMLLVSVGIIVNYSRAVILKSSFDYRSWSFFRRVLVYIWISLIFFFAIIVPFIGFVFLYGLIYNMAGGVNAPELGSYLILFIALLSWIIYLSPILLVFPAVTVDDKSMNFKQAFALAKGNRSAIFWGQFVLMIPCAVIVYLLAFLYQSMGVESYIVKFIFMIMLLGLSFLDSCFKASFFAHIYQYVTFYKGKSE